MICDMISSPDSGEVPQAEGLGRGIEDLGLTIEKGRSGEPPLPPP